MNQDLCVCLTTPTLAPFRKPFVRLRPYNESTAWPQRKICVVSFPRAQRWTASSGIKPGFSRLSTGPRLFGATISARTFSAPIFDAFWLTLNNWTVKEHWIGAETICAENELQRNRWCRNGRTEKTWSRFPPLTQRYTNQPNAAATDSHRPVIPDVIKQIKSFS